MKTLAFAIVLLGAAKASGMLKYFIRWVIAGTILGLGSFAVHLFMENMSAFIEAFF